MPQVDIDGANSKVSADTIRGQSGTTVTIQSGHNLVGSGSGLTALPAANITGTLPAISGASLTNLPPGGDKRNFIIDGDMTQWPEGTSITGAANAQYGPALWYFEKGGSTEWTLSRDTDVPTYAQSSHQSAYSFKALVTTADASLGAGDYGIFIYTITGSDYAALHGGKNVTMSFWAKFDADGSSSTSAPYSFSVSIKNSALNRSYVKELSMTADNTWQKFEFTFPTDTTGTWLFTEADKGAAISICMGTGSTYHGTDETWEGARDYATSNQENLMDYAGNAFYLSQVGLYVGDTAPTFKGESIPTVQNQVDYYVQKYDFGVLSPQTGSHTHVLATVMIYATNGSRGRFQFRNKLRANPTGTTSAAASFAVNDYGNEAVATSTSVSNNFHDGCDFVCGQAGTNWTVGRAAILTRDDYDTCWMLQDARH